MWFSTWIGYVFWALCRLIFLPINFPLPIKAFFYHLTWYNQFLIQSYFFHPYLSPFTHIGHNFSPPSHFSTDSFPYLLLAQTHNPRISTLFNTYYTIFSLPHGLPLDQPHNHHIFVLPQSTSINIKPYVPTCP